eukprot:31023-Pelagococcus_subviridis.AAC.10
MRRRARDRTPTRGATTHLRGCPCTRGSGHPKRGAPRAARAGGRSAGSPSPRPGALRCGVVSSFAGANNDDAARNSCRRRQIPRSASQSPHSRARASCTGRRDPGRRRPCTSSPWGSRTPR